MSIENETAKTPREHFNRDTDDDIPKVRERTLHRAAQYRAAQPTEARTQLLSPAEIWRT